MGTPLDMNGQTRRAGHEQMAFRSLWERWELLYGITAEQWCPASHCRDLSVCLSVYTS